MRLAVGDSIANYCLSLSFPDHRSASLVFFSNEMVDDGYIIVSAAQGAPVEGFPRESGFSS